MRARIEPWIGRASALVTIAAGAVFLRVLAGVGFANYDTLYALAWGGQLSRGQSPAYGVPIAPTPHPLVEALGVVLSPLSPHAIEQVTVALAFIALSACGWVLYRLGSLWFGRAAGALAAVVLVTRVPVLSYGSRAYVDVPYMLLVLAALLIGSRRPGAGDRGAGARAPTEVGSGAAGGANPEVEAAVPVLVLLALAGLLRPEAWAFSGLYWVYVCLFEWRRARARTRALQPATSMHPPANPTTSIRPPGTGMRLPATRIRVPSTGIRLVALALLAAAAPVVWVASDWLVTGHPWWSLTNTRHTAHTLGRVTGIGHVPEYIPRRIGEILRPPVLAGAALGGALSLLWLRRRALVGVIAGVVAVVVFAAFAAAGLPINTRYAFLVSAILCVFCGAGAFGWTSLPREDPRRRWWMAGGALVLVALAVYVPSQYRSAHREVGKLARQQAIQKDLLTLVGDHAITLRCGRVGVPNHAPVPLLALYLKTSPANIVSAQTKQISSGLYVDPASMEVEDEYVLDPLDPHLPVTVPPGFTEAHANRSWLIFQRCA